MPVFWPFSREVCSGVKSGVLVFRAGQAGEAARVRARGGPAGGRGAAGAGGRGCCVMLCYGMVWYGMVCYGMLWYIMVCYGMVRSVCRMDFELSKKEISIEAM